MSKQIKVFGVTLAFLIAGLLFLVLSWGVYTLLDTFLTNITEVSKITNPYWVILTIIGITVILLTVLGVGTRKIIKKIVS